MREFLPVLLKDGYKVGHPFQYPKDTELVYSNMTPRASRVFGDHDLMCFGPQYFVAEYLIRQFTENFFQRPRADVVRQYQRRIDHYLGPGTSVRHIEALHEVGYLPLHLKAVPEGLLVPMRVPIFTVYNTEKPFFWVTNMLETLMSNVLWQPCTSATTAFGYRQRFEDKALETGADPAFVKWQGHDFSMRGLSGLEAACLSGAAHLLSFTGTDTIPAIDFLEAYYGANVETELVGGSVAATEHSVMCMGGCANERETIRRLLTEVYPTGIVSIVWDTWNFWKGVTEHLPALRELILGRNGKLVIRPDSGDPVAIICGDPLAPVGSPERKGLVQCLWEIFGGTLTPKGFKVLDAHIGVIYGDSITPDRQREILARLRDKGYASSNVVLGIGSYTYQYVTRDTYGLAMKATYGETTSAGACPIFKDPATDSGVKKSACGLLAVHDLGGELELRENCSWEGEAQGILRTIFKDGKAYNIETLATIRARVEAQLL